MSELELSAAKQYGDGGFDVQRIQEWLTLGGFGLRIDGQFGPATEEAVRRYQTSVGEPSDGIVTPALFSRLVAPMAAALAPIPAPPPSLGPLVVAYAEQHLAQRPREVGGNNRGPWVRLYMGGHDGLEWKWCAGFACFCLDQAARTLGVALPLEPSYSCAQLGDRARAARTLLSGDDPSTPERVVPGSLFLIRGSSEQWKHVGIVRAVQSRTFTTIEGNSNENGSNDGYEVCSNVRGWRDAQGVARDFIVVQRPQS